MAFSLFSDLFAYTVEATPGIFFFSVICANISGTLLFCFYAAESRKIQLTGQRVVCFWDLRLLAVQWVCDLFLKGTGQ